MSNKAFILAAVCNEETDVITAEIVDANKKLIAKLHLSFDLPNQASIYLSPIDADAVDALPYVNSAVFASAIVQTLNRHTTPETEIALVPDISEPLEIHL